MTRPRQIAGDQAGFTLVELMVVIALSGILLTIGAFAVRQFWHVRSLTGAQDTVVTQLRQAQQRSFSESHPNVYGVRFQRGTSNFGVVRYNMNAGTCTVVNSQTLGDGVKFGQDVNDPDTDFADVTNLTAACRDVNPNGSLNNEVVFFYPRGNSSATAAAGTVEVYQPAINRAKEVQVAPLTGRVTRV